MRREHKIIIALGITASNFVMWSGSSIADELKAPQIYGICMEEAAVEFSGDCFGLLDTALAAEGRCKSEKLSAQWYYAEKDRGVPEGFTLADKFSELERSRVAVMVLLHRRANPEICE
ncbi:hypothetical protein SI859A1_00917 [Aurantimonas manganoxydans SI85-9A1]|uniref:Uncharacterized protein n=1 Tax=Aurantimonas manganoxydans (strain ATCC BAA-1229 / DSM 21871 / SI85-9A1) TaxID=287752 RepID=Q1YJT1_AURMS|nr:hypothetical protein [Aurantimonas manganoxydans]EAS50792.1 hypothetical protein SI859A1_00917 [Aurantimonas manganoxydans SI85-9A1]